MDNMDEYFVLFREYMLVQKPSSVNTRDSYLRDVSAFLRYLEGENITSPLEVETETVEAYVQHLHSLNRTNSTISRNIASVRCFYKFLILRGDMQVNPAKSVKLEKEPKKLPQTLTSEEIDLLLSQPNVTEAKGCRDKAMLELLYATGIRVSELINLNVQDINLRTGKLFCRGTKGVRTIPIYAKAVVAVSDYLYRMRRFDRGPGQQRRRAVCQSERLAFDAPGFLENYQGVYGGGRHHEGDYAAHAASFVCHAPFAGRCFRKRHSNHDGTCRYFVHTGICSFIRP